MTFVLENRQKTFLPLPTTTENTFPDSLSTKISLDPESKWLSHSINHIRIHAHKKHAQGTRISSYLLHDKTLLTFST